MIDIVMGQDDTPHVVRIDAECLNLRDRGFCGVEGGADSAQKGIAQAIAGIA
ncbi:hypothetical protein HMPREF9057_00565 [Actinomyces sp. oral taxon 171 str. F0337]|nr:hypothetical protein HMPREF9057_00565 [Actinomyces sp. oral taxon 171 str. F0337]